MTQWQCQWANDKTELNHSFNRGAYNQVVGSLIQHDHGMNEGFDEGPCMIRHYSLLPYWVEVLTSGQWPTVSLTPARIPYWSLICYYLVWLCTRAKALGLGLGSLEGLVSIVAPSTGQGLSLDWPGLELRLTLPGRASVRPSLLRRFSSVCKQYI